MRSLVPSLLVCATLACQPPPEPGLQARIDRALERGLACVLARQADDGAWRSETYGALEDDWALTATMAKALVFVPADADTTAALERGLAWLASAVRADGTISPGEAGLAYPVYTSALAVMAFARADPRDPERWARERDAWLGLLESHQLDEHLGWSPDDAAYGGWGYAAVPPRKGERHGFEADLSSTLFALGALRQAGRPASDARVQRARAFVLRCQNLPLAGEAPDPARDDGGFFMSPTVALQNKAGGAWKGASGRWRFASYGSMTADGLRALLRLGFGPESEEVRAARAWLERQFEADSNPGDFDELHAADGQSAYHYWAWSAAHALAELGVARLANGASERVWARELAEELLAHQRGDGSWSNRFTMMKEDDPLVATPLALAALSLCRVSLLFAAE